LPPPAPPFSFLAHMGQDVALRSPFQSVPLFPVPLLANTARTPLPLLPSPRPPPTRVFFPRAVLFVCSRLTPHPPEFSIPPPPPFPTEFLDPTSIGQRGFSFPALLYKVQARVRTPPIAPNYEIPSSTLPYAISLPALFREVSGSFFSVEVSLFAAHLPPASFFPEGSYPASRRFFFLF